jgi:hypothetical protein
MSQSGNLKKNETGNRQQLGNQSAIKREWLPHHPAKEQLLTKNENYDVS